MYQFSITMEKDLTEAYKILPKPLQMPYRIAIKGAWHTFVGVLGDKLMKEFNPVKEENKVTYTRRSENIKELEEDKQKLENFIYGDVDQIKENDKARKILSNRSISWMYTRIKRFIKNQTQRRSILTLMNSCSLFISWKVEKI